MKGRERGISADYDILTDNKQKGKRINARPKDLAELNKPWPPLEQGQKNESVK